MIWTVARLEYRVSIHAPVGGATSISKSLKSSTASFNSRARRGRDVALDGDALYIDVSIHAPVGGATKDVTKLSMLFSVSIHAPVGGATVVDVLYTTRPVVSIHAPVGGATASKEDAEALIEFQFTRP